jgi:Domain of unknown function (DUF4124)
MAKGDAGMTRSSSFFVAIIACGAALCFALPAGAQTMYKYIDANGKTVYSDHPPPAGTKFDTIRANTKPTGVDLHPGSAQDAAAMADERHTKEAARDQRIADAKQQYDAAVAALEAAKEPQEGDRTENKNGTSRLNESYQERVAPLEKKVEEMRQKLEEAQRS